MFDIDTNYDKIERDDPRLSEKAAEGTRVVPAHEQIYAGLALKHEGFSEAFYIHYMWSNVSCIRVRKGKLKQAFSFLSNGGYVTPFEAEERLRGLIAGACSEYMNQSGFRVGFDTKRNNDGYTGFYTYLGVCNCESFLALGKKRKREREEAANAPTPTFSNNPLREKLLQSLNSLEAVVEGMEE